MIPMVSVDDSVSGGQSSENAGDELIFIEGVCGDSLGPFHNPLLQNKFQRGKIQGNQFWIDFITVTNDCVGSWEANEGYI